MQHILVKKLFEEQIKHYSRKDQAVNSPIVALFQDWIKKNNIKKTLKICEFGGGSGQLINQIRKEYPNASFTVSEIIEDYKNYLASKEIKFVKTSILNPAFKERSFDVLIIRDILHHLVGQNYKGTLDNQRLALFQLKRLATPGGVIFIEELTNGSELICLIIYVLSKLNSSLKIPFVPVNKNTIVSFLTPKRLVSLCKGTFKEENVTVKNCYVGNDFKSRVLHLGIKPNKLAIVIKQ